MNIRELIELAESENIDFAMSYKNKDKVLHIEFSVPHISGHAINRKGYKITIEAIKYAVIDVIELGIIESIKILNKGK